MNLDFGTWILDFQNTRIATVNYFINPTYKNESLT
jgi:hypothetical protein